MNKQEAVKKMTDIMAKLVEYSGKVLPDDVLKKLAELRGKETWNFKNYFIILCLKIKKLAKRIGGPSCQRYRVLQFFVKCGTDFP